MGPTEVFPNLLTSDSERDLRERLRAQRIGQFRTLLAERDTFETLTPFIRAVSRLYASSPESALTFLDAWPTTYYSSQLLHHGLDSVAAATRLTAGLLFERMTDGSSPLAGQEFTMQTEADGSVAVPQRAGRLVFDDFRAGPYVLRWECEGDRARIRRIGSNAGDVEIPLPLRPDGSSGIRFLDCPRAADWDIPILDRGRELLFHFSRTPDSGARGDARESLSLGRTLSAAFHTLHNVWPECVQWTRALIPAFAELEDEYVPGKRQSGSFGPGIPVYLTRVADEHLHAEDIVHELQHQRFQLIVPADDWFALWPRRSELFVSPYRADLRPMAGIHLGVHAFVTVNEFRMRYIVSSGPNEAVLTELASLHHKNVFALRTIVAHEHLQTASARTYYATLARAMASHQAFLDSRMADFTAERTAVALERHLEYVRRNSGRRASYKRPSVEELQGYVHSLQQEGVGA